MINFFLIYLMKLKIFFYKVFLIKYVQNVLKTWNWTNKPKDVFANRAISFLSKIINV